MLKRLHSGHLYGTPKPDNVRIEDADMVSDARGPLPPNWEIAYSELGERYFIELAISAHERVSHRARLATTPERHNGTIRGTRTHYLRAGNEWTTKCTAPSMSSRLLRIDTGSKICAQKYLLVGWEFLAVTLRFS